MNLNIQTTTEELIAYSLRKLGEDFNLESLMNLESIIQEVMEKNYDPDTLSPVIEAWGEFYGECIIRNLSANWDENNFDLLLWNGNKVSPFDSVISFAVTKELDSLVKEFTNLATQYANEKTNFETGEEEPIEKKIEFLLNDVLCLRGFKRVDSPEEITATYNAREEMRRRIKDLKFLDKNIEEYDEYKSLQQMDVTAEEFRLQLEKLESKVIGKASGKKLLDLGYLNMDFYEEEMKDPLHTVKKDYYMKRAEYWLTQSANKGDVEAMSTLSILYYCGYYDFAPDFYKRMYWLKRAAEVGDIYSMMELAYIYRDGNEVTDIDNKEAIYWIKKTVEAGEPEGMYLMGKCYYEGAGIEQDYGMALYWFGEAAAAGDTDSMKELAKMYQNGIGVPVDLEKAREWFEKSCKKK